MVKKCAVIWCEDHRSLAYFNGASDSFEDQSRLNPGDLVEFDVREDGDLRIALSPSIVAEGHYMSLPDDLMRATKTPEAAEKTCTCVTYQTNGCAHVVPFPEVAHNKKRANSFSTPTGRRAG